MIPIRTAIPPYNENLETNTPKPEFIPLFQPNLSIRQACFPILYSVVK